jgi:hypothetical protein
VYNNVGFEMTVCQNTVTFICTVLIFTALFSEGFVIPPYNYYGYMGGNYFPCNWGYSYCSYTPEYYYGNGCGCDYNVGNCDPCVGGLQSFPQWPSVSYPGVPDVPVFQPFSGLTSFPGLGSVYGSPVVPGLASVFGSPDVSSLASVYGSPDVPSLASVYGSPDVPRLTSVPESPNDPRLASVPGSPSFHEPPISPSVENRPVEGHAGKPVLPLEEEHDNSVENNGDVNGNGEDAEDEEENGENGGKKDEEEDEEDEDEEEYAEDNDDEDDDKNGGETEEE